jgi:hypothetical protein
VKNIKNLDGIYKSKKISINIRPKQAKPRILKIDSIIKRPVKRVAAKTVLSHFFVVPGKTEAKQTAPVLFFRKIYSQKKVPVAVAVFGLILAFAFGMWSVLNTKSTIADSQPQILGAFSSEPNAHQITPSGSPIAGAELQGQSGSNLSNDVLFNTPLEMLKDYLTDTLAAGQLEIRKSKLHEFLKDRGSPLEPQADLIAEQQHWKLILAISFAESTLGEKCFDFNCSGIGGSQIRSYKSFDNWILDFNRLLEKRYKDKTLEQMCGVYVKPCNPNWLLATKQILTALDQENIE